jgi:cellulose synthase operon protein YhjQ
MSDRGPLYDQGETPEDVATLYSWANLHGAKYRDFSESRAHTREQARLRMQQAIEAEQARAQQLAQVERVAETQRMSEDAGLEEEAKHAEWMSRQAAEEAAHKAEEQAAREVAEKAAIEAARQAEERAAREAVRRAEELAAQETARLAAEEAARKAEEQAAREAAEKAAIEAARQADERAAREAARLAAEEAARKAEELAARQAAEQAAIEAAFQAAEKAAQEKAAQEFAKQEAARLAAEKAAQEAARLAAEETARKAAEQAAREAAEKAAREDAAHLRETERIPEPAFTTQYADLKQPSVEPFAALSPSELAEKVAASLPSKRDYTSYAPPQPVYPTFTQQQPAAVREEPAETRSAWGPADRGEQASRPAWLTPERNETSTQPVAEHAPEDTLQGSRDRLASRWYALRGIFDAAGAPPEPVPSAPPPRAPMLAVFSLAGGVGKTCLAATLGRALSARGERVLLVDTAAYGLMPFFFGAQDQRPGVLRTFSPPGTSGDAPVQLLTIDPESLTTENAAEEVLTAEIGKYSRGLSRVIVDLPTASGATTRRIIGMSPLVVVPMVPDMNSVVSISSIDAFFERNAAGNAKQSLPFYVLNQFDASLPLHLDIREVLREQLGDRLLPMVLRRTPAVSEALAEGMTVMDYAPNSTVAEDFATLASWVKSQSAPATSVYRGVRWSER